jgi:hypothetical protein
VKWIQSKAGEFAKKLYGTDTPSKEQIAQAQTYLAYAALGNNDNGEQKANVLLGLGKDESYIAAKQFLGNQPDVFINDQGKAQRVFTVQGNEFYEPLKYSQYNADAAYRDFMWNSVGINYAPPANASAQDKVLYEQREKERLARDAKGLLAGMIPGVMAIGAGTILNRSPAVKLPTSVEAEAASQAAKLEIVRATSGPKGVGEAYSVALNPKLAEQLTMQSAKSPFTTAGTLTPDVIKGADQIIAPSELMNPNIPSGFGKYTTSTFQSPAGDFQIHFYKNPTTGEVFYGLDYKAVFNNMPGVPKKP